MTTAALLRASELGFAFGTTPVLHEVSLRVEPGRLLVVTGPNGAGKTTLLRLLAGVNKPARGSVELLGEPLERLSRREVAQRLAVVPQELICPFPFRVQELVLMGRAP